MSGGSYDYAYLRIEELANNIRPKGGCNAAPPHVRAAFCELLERCARAAKAIEWNDSYDGDADEEALIRAALSDKNAALSTLIDAAGTIMKQLRAETERANCGGRS